MNVPLSPRLSRSPCASERPARLLVVDDTQDSLEMMQLLLEGAGYDVYVATRGEEAIALAQDRLPDLIVLDVMMPDMDGFDVGDVLGTDARTDGIPLLFVSGRHDRAAKARARMSGGQDFLSKPFQTTTLLAKVDTLLSRRTRGECA